MKLIDILVRDLPGRGGFPEGEEFCWCDPDGEVRFSQNEFFDFYPDLGNNVVCSERGSYHGDDSFYVTREQYEAAIDHRTETVQIMCNLFGNGIHCNEKTGYGEVWFNVYDTIAAGGIHGIKLEVK